MLQDLCLLLSLSVQVAAPKPAGFLPEAQQWVREHAGDWESGSFLAERLRKPRTIVLVRPAPEGVATMVVTRFFETLLAREEPLVIGVPANWDEGHALDARLAGGKTEPAALLPKNVLELARAWNADEKHTRKLRAAGLDYRAAREQALALSEFVARVDGQSSQRTAELLSPFRQTGPDGQHRYGKVDENWRFAVRTVLQDLDGQVAERRAEWEKDAGAAFVAAGLRNLSRMRQFEEEFSKPAEFRRGRALCQNAAAARDELAGEAPLLACVPLEAGPELSEAHAALGADALVVLILSQGETPADPDFTALSSVRAGGALDLRELPKEGAVASWFGAHVGKRADIVLWAGVR